VSQFYRLHYLAGATLLFWFATHSLTAPVSGNAADLPSVRWVESPAQSRPIRLQVDQRGTLHLACDSPQGPTYRASHDQGVSWSKPIALVPANAIRPGLEFIVWDMAVEPEGRVHVALGSNAWKLKLPHEEWGFHYARVAPTEQQSVDFKNINRRPSEGFSLAVDGKGKVAACWLADRLYVNLSTNHGDSFGPTRELDKSLDPCNCCTTSSVFGADGRLAILYREETNNDRDMFVALWDIAQDRVDRKAVSQTRWKIDACPMTYYTIATNGNGFLAAWPTRKQVYFAQLDARGNLLTPREIPTPGQAGMRTGLLALANRRGQFLIAWNGENQVGWQVFDAQGQAIGPAGRTSYRGKAVAGFVNQEDQFVLIK
jgi:hypothetical protein